LTKYLRVTQQLIEEGRDAVSSKELGDFTGINPVQVRRDLNAIGFSGTRGVGYQAYDLVEAVRNIWASSRRTTSRWSARATWGAPSPAARSCPSAGS
jgi:redox-sensing transcriptional repressor